MTGFVITQPHGLACEVLNQTYSDATGVPMWVTVFADGYVGRYVTASADTLDYLLTLPSYAPGTRAGAALAFARDAAREV